MQSTSEALSHFAVGRRSPIDPFFSAGDAICKPYRRLGVFDIDDEDLCHEIVAEFPCGVPGCNAQFDTLLQYDMHYNTAHRYICTECRKPLPSAHLLDLHLLEIHDSFFRAQAERKPMYRCYVEECNTLFANPEERRNHCISVHNFPRDFRFDTAWRKQKSTNECQMETDIPLAKNKFLSNSRTCTFGRGTRGGKNWFSKGKSVLKSTNDMDKAMRDLKDSLPDQSS